VSEFEGEPSKVPAKPESAHLLGRLPCTAPPRRLLAKRLRLMNAPTLAALLAWD